VFVGDLEPKFLLSVALAAVSESTESLLSFEQHYCTISTVSSVTRHGQKKSPRFKSLELKRKFIGHLSLQFFRIHVEMVQLKKASSGFSPRCVPMSDSETKTKPPVESAVDSPMVSLLFAVELRPSSQFKDVSLAQIGAPENSSVPRQKHPISPPVGLF